MSYSLIGLRPEADKYIISNLNSIDDSYVHTFGNEFDLLEYDLKDEQTVKEVIQCIREEDNSVFLCLSNEDKDRLFEWTEEEMKEYKSII